MTGMGLIQRSFSGGILILVIMAARILWLDKLPKRTFPILWSVALFRLLLPFSLPSACSVYSLLQAGQRAVSEAEVRTVAEGMTITGDRPVWAAMGYLAMGEELPASYAQSGVPALTVLWGLGAFLGGAFFAAAYLRGLWRFREAVPVDDEQVRQWLARHRMRRRISVRQSDRISAPLTYGILRPVILLPKKEVLCRQELEYVLQHEYVHIYRWDAALKLAMVAALCVHWFNPVLWMMAGLLNRDIELACDEDVLRRFGRQSRAEYAMTLIRMEEKKQSLVPIYNGFSKNAIEERINLIMKYRKVRYAAIVAAALLVLSVALVFGTSAKKAQATEGEAVTDRAGTDFADSELMDPPRGNPEHVEGFGTQLDAIVKNFGILPEEGGAGLTEDEQQARALVMAFWDAYLAGNEAGIKAYLSDDYDDRIEAFPNGEDGHVAEEAALVNVKGLDFGEKPSGDTREAWIEFRPAAGADYLEYLTLELVKEAEGWKVRFYGLEL